MNKEEMKNKISMALKDPILQQGFEIICKENAELKEVHESDKRSLRLIAEKGAELEAKIAYLTQHLEPQAMTALFEQVEEEVNQEQKIKELEAYNEKLLNGDIEKHNKIVELEKENEELKAKIENLQKYLDTQNSYRECAETWEKLTKAKDLIKKIIRVTWGEGWNYSLDVKVKAEQFLKECEQNE